MSKQKQKPKPLHAWEVLTESTDRWGQVSQATRRCRVPGGWLYQVSSKPIYNGGFIQSIIGLRWHPPVFVPEVR